MSEQGSSSTKSGDGGDDVNKIGRGRGRGNHPSDELGRHSEKREASEGDSANQKIISRGSKREMNIVPVYKTRPATANSKCGTSGTTLQLSANYFKLMQKTNFEFKLYRVDFEPEVELALLRKRFVRNHKDTFGGYLFDGGNMLYLTRRLPEDSMHFLDESREGQRYEMKVTDTGKTISTTDSMAMQILNIVLRRAMDGLHMELVGRNMYDPLNKVSFLKKFSKAQLFIFGLFSGQPA